MAPNAWRKLALTIGAAFAPFAAPSVAAADPAARLVSCGAESCLLVTGHRDSGEAAVLINGHSVDVEGGRSWRVRLPLATVRDWSEPFARKIEVSLQDPKTPETQANYAVLPIGLLGHAPDLASLVITLH